MKRYLSLFLFLSCTLLMQAQNIVVQSFRLDESDLTANTAGTIVMDQNGQKCALIKVETSETGFAFDTGTLGVSKTEQHVGEIWVYVPEGVKRITISHQEFGVLRDYDLGQTLKRAKTYIMKLTTGEVQTIRFQAPTPILGEADINSSPAMADIYIDGKKVGQTPQLISDLMIGEHQYRLSRQGYTDYSGTLTIREGETVQVNATLNNATQITVTSTNPNATLYIDGTAHGTASGTKNTSYGQHQIRLTADGWREYTTTISVSESQRSFNFPMEEIVQSRRTVTVGNVSFTMIRVDGGTFTMGATSEQGSDAYDDEKPAHQVTLLPYYIGETEVTQALWKAVMGKNPSYFKSANKPVECVTWENCQSFIKKLNRKTGLSFRLPTEAEWEYAAHGGNMSQGYKYSGSNNLSEVAWYDDNSGFMTHDVKTKQANELGLYDMCGNVWEWCQDWYGEYSSGSQTNPAGLSSGSYRVRRGGSWINIARYCRVSIRGDLTPDDGNYSLGLRLALQ